MTVGELEELLAMLPADMPVYLRCSDLGARHIDRVTKQPSHKVKPDIARAIDAGFKGTTVHVNGRHPQALVIEASSSSPLWCHAFGDQVEFEVRGRWPADPAQRERVAGVRPDGVRSAADGRASALTLPGPAAPRRRHGEA